jgi:hypothetical protein
MTPAQVWGLLFRPRDGDQKLIRAQRPGDAADRLTPEMVERLAIPEDVFEDAMCAGIRDVGYIQNFFAVQQLWWGRTPEQAREAWEENLEAERRRPEEVAKMKEQWREKGWVGR